MSKETLKKFQDELRDIIAKKALQEWIKINHYDLSIVAEYSDEYSASSSKLNSINDFAEKSDPTDHIAMFDIVSSSYKAYKCMAMKAIVTLIMNHRESFSSWELKEMLSVMNKLLDDIDMDSSLVNTLTAINWTPSTEEVRKTILESIKIFKN